MFYLEVDAKYIKGMLNNPDIQPNNTINRWIAGILLFNFKLVHVPGKLHKGPDGLSRRRPTPDDKEEPQDDWVDEVLGLGIWVNSWIAAQALEKAGSMLPCFQQSVSYPTRGQVVTPESAIDKEDIPLLPLPAPPFLFLSFSLNSVPGDATCVDIPRSEVDVRADMELPSIWEFLNTAHKPVGLDDTALKKFLKQATRFFLCNNQLWRWGPSQTHRLVIIPPKD